MISSIATKIFSELGSNSSLLPMAVKDVSNSLGMTAGSYMASKNKVEGKDRFIDEFGTQGIWLFGLPIYKKLIDLTAYKIAGYNSKVDIRVLKNSKIKDLAVKYAPEKVKASITHAAEHSKTFKGLFIGKFVAATALTMGSYAWLTSYRHKYTEKEQIREIKKELAQEEAQKKQQSFKAAKAKALSFGAAPLQTATKAINNLMFNPVKNMMLLDGGITGERLADARDPQDLMGYVVKEGAFWAFIYFAGDKIQHFFENRAVKKHDKSIDLDIKVLQDKDFQKAIGNKEKAQSDLDEFLFKTVKVEKNINGKKVLTDAKVQKSEEEIYEYICTHKNNIVVKTAKKAGAISEYQEYSDNFVDKLLQKTGLKKAKSTGKIDTQKFIDVSEKGEMVSIHKKISKLVEQFHNPKNNQSLDSFFNQVLKLKRFSIMRSIGICIAVLGVITPGIMVYERKHGENNEEFQVKKALKEKIKRGEIDLSKY